MSTTAFPEEIAGERIVLVRHRLDLADAAAEAIEESLEHLRPWQPWAEKFEGVQSCIQYTNWVRPQWGTRFDFQILDRQDGRFLGQANLEGYRPDVPAISIGYWLRTSALGKGYATESAILLRDVAFERLGVERCELLCDALNAKSAEVAKRLGMTLEGVLRHDRRGSGGRLQDTMVWSLLLSEYLRLNG